MRTGLQSRVRKLVLSSFWHRPRSFGRLSQSRLAPFLVGALILLGTLALPRSSLAGQVTLEWNRNPERGVSYLIAYGTSPGNPTASINVGKRTTGTIRDLIDGQRYYFVVYAFIHTAISPASNEVSFVVQPQGRRARSGAAGETRGPALPRNAATTSATSSATVDAAISSSTDAPAPSLAADSPALAAVDTGCPIALSSGGTGVDSGSYLVTVMVDAAADCSWKATSSAPWLTVVHGEEGAGRGRVELLVATKRAAGSRAAEVQFGTSASFTVSQSGGTATALFAGPAWDVDRDGRADLTVWRQGTGDWYIRPSGTPGVPFVRNWGVAGDVPVPGDYDGDTVGDLAVWRPSSGVWHVLLSSSDFTESLEVPLGAGDDVPVPADYDGDGRTDPGVWRPADGTWTIRTSSTGYTEPSSAHFGGAGDKPVVGDFDGDGKADPGLWQPRTGNWIVKLSHASHAPAHTVHFQAVDQTDAPLVGDFDGDGASDIAFCGSRPARGICSSRKAALPNRRAARSREAGQRPATRPSRPITTVTAARMWRCGVCRATSGS
jgi:hypothetical protein